MDVPRPSDGDIIRVVDLSGAILCEGPVILDYPITEGYVIIAANRRTDQVHGFVLERHTNTDPSWWEIWTDRAVVITVLDAAVGAWPSIVAIAPV